MFLVQAEINPELSFRFYSYQEVKRKMKFWSGLRRVVSGETAKSS